MPTFSRDTFLERIRFDASLQRRLKEVEAREVAVAIARAAGYEVDAADLLTHSQNTTAVSEAGEDIDFDGDGVPDAICVDGTWVLQPQDD